VYWYVSFILFRAIPTYSIVDYIRGGCEINLIVAIDFTVRDSDTIKYIRVCDYDHAIVCRAPTENPVTRIRYTTTIPTRSIYILVYNIWDSIMEMYVKMFLVTPHSVKTIYKLLLIKLFYLYIP